MKEILAIIAILIMGVATTASSYAGISSTQTASNHGLSTKLLEELRFLAEQGSVRAQFKLGVMYAEGQDYSKAHKWFTKAAENGFPRAQFNIGLMYARGQGIPLDYAKSYKWAILASNQGFTAAFQLSFALTTLMTLEELTKAQKMISEWEVK